MNLGDSEPWGLTWGLTCLPSPRAGGGEGWESG